MPPLFLTVEGLHVHDCSSQSYGGDFPLIEGKLLLKSGGN